MQMLKTDVDKQSMLEQSRLQGETPSIYPINESDLLLTPNCPLCGSQSIAPIAEIWIKKELNFFQTSTCRRCLFTYRSINPSLRWFQRCWRHIHEKVYRGKIEVFNPETEKVRRRRYLQYVGLLSQFGKPGILLEVGAAYGTGSKVCREWGCEVDVIEPEMSKRKYIEQELKIPVVASSVEKFVRGQAYKQYDFIVFAACLEHLPQPKYVLSRLGKFLKPGGTMYLDVPIFWKYINWSDAFYLPHKGNFGKENFLNLVEYCGFRVIKQLWIRDRDEQIPFDFGLLLQRTDANNHGIKHGTTFAADRGKYSLRDVRALYRKDLPLKELDVAPDAVLRYSVPVIQHASQIILGDKSMVAPTMTDPFITFG